MASGVCASVSVVAAQLLDSPVCVRSSGDSSLFTFHRFGVLIPKIISALTKVLTIDPLLFKLTSAIGVNTAT